MYQSPHPGCHDNVDTGTNHTQLEAHLMVGTSQLLIRLLCWLSALSCPLDWITVRALSYSAWGNKSTLAQL